MPKIKIHFISTMFVFFIAVVGVLGIIQSKTAFITVSNTVNGRELPIYCVDTNEKKVAISFDAAWGDGSLRKVV